MPDKIKVTREWAKTHHACRKSIRRFFAHWPNGLTLTRRNLYMVAKEVPVSDLAWFAGQFRLISRISASSFDTLYDLALSSNEDHWVISPAKKHAVAKALADALDLP